MVAVVKDGYSIRNVLSYNENKVKEGAAECIAAVNYPKDLEWLSYANKLSRLERQAALRPGVKRNHVHISLNFAPGEHFDREKLNEIANTYMQKIGMGDQPYLVYEHHDAGHPHIHIVSMKIKADGEKVAWNDIGKNQSSKARREIEEEFGLVKADDHGGEEAFELKPVIRQKAQYGTTETKRAITNVLSEVFEKYKFSSFEEYNVLLSKYNVTADKGSPNSRTCINGGLNYSILNNEGKRIGVPIKASKFYNKPTLKAVEDKAKQNDEFRFKYRQKLKTAIDKYFITASNPGFENFKQELAKQKIDLVLNKNKQGQVSGLWFIDFGNKSIFKGSDVDRAYTYNGLQNKFQRIGKKAAQELPEHLKYQKKNEPKSGDTGLAREKSSLYIKGNYVQKSLYKIPFAREPRPATYTFHIITKWVHVVFDPAQAGYEQVPYAHMIGKYKKTRKKQGN